MRRCGVCECTAEISHISSTADVRGGMSSERWKTPSNSVGPWGSPEPYVQLVRCLLPRATSLSLFDAIGSLRWTSETLTGPDLPNFVAEVAARAEPGTAG